MKGYYWITEIQECMQEPFFRNFKSKGCSRALTLRKHLTYKSEWAHKLYWIKNWAQAEKVRKVKSWKWRISAILNLKTQFKIDQTFFCTS